MRTHFKNGLLRGIFLLALALCLCGGGAAFAQVGVHVSRSLRPSVQH